MGAPRNVQCKLTCDRLVTKAPDRHVNPEPTHQTCEQNSRYARMVLVERFNSRRFKVFYGSRYIAVDRTVEFSNRSVVGSGRTIHTHTTVIGRRLSYARRSGRRTVCLKPLYAASPLCAQFRAHFCRPLFEASTSWPPFLVAHGNALAYEREDRQAFCRGFYAALECALSARPRL